MPSAKTFGSTNSIVPGGIGGVDPFHPVAAGAPPVNPTPEQLAARTTPQPVPKPPTYGSVTPGETPKKPVEPAVVSSSNITDNVAPKNAQMLQQLSNKGMYVSEDGFTRYADGTMAPAPVGAESADNGAWTADGKTYGAAPQYVTGDDEESQKFNELLGGLKSSLDSSTKRQVDAIEQQHSILSGIQQDANARAGSAREHALLTAGGSTGGTSRYAPFSASGTVLAETSFGLQQIAALDAKENAALAQVYAAQESGNQQIMDKALAAVQDSRKRKQDAAQKIIDANQKRIDAANEQQIQASRDGAVADLVQQGVTDPAQILDVLNYHEDGTLVGDFTAEEIGKTLKNIVDSTGANGIKGLTGDIGNFYTLKNTPGALPASILALPADQQLAAYIKMVNDAKTKDSGYTLGPNSTRYDANGKIVARGTQTGGSGTGNGDIDPNTISQTSKDYAASFLAGNTTSMSQVPAKNRDEVAYLLNHQDQESFSPLAARRFTMAANAIVKPYMDLPQYSLTANGLPYLERIDAAIKVPGSVSDQDLLDSLTKLNTAGNAVTDAQVKLVTDGKSWSDSVGVWANHLGNGGVLSTNQREQIQKIAKNIYENYRKGYQPVYDKAVKQLTDSGIPKPFWVIPDLNELGAKAYPEYFGVPNHPDIGSSDNLDNFLGSAPANGVSPGGPIDWENAH